MSAWDCTGKRETEQKVTNTNRLVSDTIIMQILRRQYVIEELVGWGVGI